MPPTDPTAALRTALEAIRSIPGNPLSRERVNAALRAALASQADDPSGRVGCPLDCQHQGPCRESECGHHEWQHRQADDPSDEARRARNRTRSMGEDASGGYREIAGCGCEECERHRQADDPSDQRATLDVLREAMPDDFGQADDPSGPDSRESLIDDAVRCWLAGDTKGLNGAMTDLAAIRAKP